MRWIAEIDAHDGMGDVTLRYADGTLTTLPTDTPPNTAIRGLVAQVGGYEQSISPQDPGSSDQRAGAIKLHNLGDGDLDHLKGYAIGGRAVTIYRTDAGWAEREAVFEGVSEQPLIGYRDVQIGIASRLDALAVPLQTTTYAGTTTDGTAQDAEGRPSDLGGKPKPLLRGRAFNIPAPAVDVYNLVYQVNDGALASLDAVRDSGVALTPGVDRATLAALYATTPAAGVYDTCLAGGYFRLGSTPNGEITCDATEGTDLAPGSVAARILSHIEIANVDTASLTAYAAAVPVNSGVWIGTQSTEALGILQHVLGSGGAGLTVTPLGTIRCVQIAAPSGTPDVTAKITGIIESGATIETRNVPVVWRVVVRYRRYHQTQTSLAGAATAEYGAEWREVVAEDPAVKTLYPLASELVIETAFAGANGAQIFADAWLALHGVRRNIHTIKQKASLADVAKIGDVAGIEIDRLGLDGLPLIVTGINSGLLTDTVEWEAWG